MATWPRVSLLFLALAGSARAEPVATPFEAWTLSWDTAGATPYCAISARDAAGTLVQAYALHEGNGWLFRPRGGATPDWIGRGVTLSVDDRLFSSRVSAVSDGIAYFRYPGPDHTRLLSLAGSSAWLTVQNPAGTAHAFPLRGFLRAGWALLRCERGLQNRRMDMVRSGITRLAVPRRAIRQPT